jgi:hypothetical protein
MSQSLQESRGGSDAVQGWVVGRREATCSSVSGKSPARALHGRLRHERRRDCPADPTSGGWHLRCIAILKRIGWMSWSSRPASRSVVSSANDLSDSGAIIGINSAWRFVPHYGAGLLEWCGHGHSGPLPRQGDLVGAGRAGLAWRPGHRGQPPSHWPTSHREGQTPRDQADRQDQPSSDS